MLCPTATAEAAPITYAVSVNTGGGVQGTSGFLDLQFNPATPSFSPAATATVGNFALIGGGSLTNPAETIGSVSGSLPGPVVIANGGTLNDYFQGVTFGNSLNFTVTLGGPALDAPNNSGFGSVFSLYLFRADPLAPGNLIPIFSTAAGDGELLRLQLNSNGSVNVLNQVGGSVLTVTPVADPIPEPATLLLAATGLAGVALTRRR